MKNVVLGLVALIVLIVLGVVGMAMTKPDVIHVERSIMADATVADVGPFTTDLRKHHQWDPWEKKDPDSKREYSENAAGVGAWYTWDGNEEVGSGKQTITAIEPGKTVQKLEFYSPWTGVADSTLAYAAVGEQVKVTWSMDQPADFPSKVMQLFMSMDDMLGPDFEAGLAGLKPLVEAAATERAAIAEEKAKAAAAEAAAAEAAAAEEEAAAEPGAK